MCINRVGSCPLLVHFLSQLNPTGINRFLFCSKPFLTFFAYLHLGFESVLFLFEVHEQNVLVISYVSQSS
jgi:hypothetical protein